VKTDTTRGLVLLVDDNPANLKILYETLNGRGYKLLVADSGAKALSIAQKMQPELILLDIMMPGMDGYEVCRRLQQNGLTESVSVVFLSALDDTDAKVLGFELGGVDYISKPFQVKEVIARVDTHLRLRLLEKALGQQNKELLIDNSSILRAMGEGIYGLDKSGQIIFANPAACRANQCEVDTLLGQRFVELQFSGRGAAPGQSSGAATEFDHERMIRHVEKAMADDESIRVEQALFFRPAGGFFPASFQLTIVPDSASSTHAVVVFRDISDKLAQDRELEQARLKLEAQRAQLTHVSRLSTMGEMAAGIAHEVNQPLTAIVNYARLASRQLVSLKNRVTATRELEAAAETLEKIEQQSLRASDVIQHIRDFVRKPTEGKARLSATELADAIIQLTGIEAKQHAMTLKVDIDPSLPELRVEAIQIQQVALNLLRNAMEASLSTASNTVHFRVYHDKAGDNHVHFEIEDRGSGVTEENQPFLFNPFFTTKKTGMGIGLTLCQNIVQAHGGRIGYQPAKQNDPAVESGSLFWFSLPVLAE
tara:strand:+ start:41424 stop:43037 length:1614 start_codon:yes stop_codon:yes gene_type:complete